MYKVKTLVATAVLAAASLAAHAGPNDFAYNRFGAGPYGIRASVGAAAPATSHRPPLRRSAPCVLTDVDGRSFTTQLESIR
jgi:hypothetical protein